MMEPRIPRSDDEYAKYMAERIKKIKERATQLEPKSPRQKGFEYDVAGIFKELETLLLKKHKDYGPTNISEAPGGAMNGLLVRMHDKMARLKNLTYVSTYGKPQFESIEDTLSDLANYAIIGLLVLRGKWDEENQDDTHLKEAKKVWNKQL